MQIYKSLDQGNMCGLTVTVEEPFHIIHMRSFPEAQNIALTHAARVEAQNVWLNACVNIRCHPGIIHHSRAPVESSTWVAITVTAGLYCWWIPLVSGDMWERFLRSVTQLYAHKKADRWVSPDQHSHGQRGPDALRFDFSHMQQASMGNWIDPRPRAYSTLLSNLWSSELYTKIHDPVTCEGCINMHQNLCSLRCSFWSCDPIKIPVGPNVTTS